MNSAIQTVIFSIDAKIIICGVCKNIEPYLPTTIEAIEEIGSHFNDYRVFVYENNSVDDTKTILKKWSNLNSKVAACCEDFSDEELLLMTSSRTSDFKPCRVELIARARNIVLSEAMSSKYDEYEYLIMLDMDSHKKLDVEDILSNFSISIEWDAIFANGHISEGPRIGEVFDCYAWRDPIRVPVGPELIGGFFWHNFPYEGMKFERDHPLIPVYSAFGGLGIYKRASIVNCFYTAHSCIELTKLYAEILSSIRENKYVNEYKKKNRKQNNIVEFINNTGFNRPIVCEHVTFHAQMISNGFNKFFVNPNMMFYY